jgi:hypothetical protein
MANKVTVKPKLREYGVTFPFGRRLYIAGEVINAWKAYAIIEAYSKNEAMNKATDFFGRSWQTVYPASIFSEDKPWHYPTGRLMHIEYGAKPLVKIEVIK